MMSRNLPLTRLGRRSLLSLLLPLTLASCGSHDESGSGARPGRPVGDLSVVTVEKVEVQDFVDWPGTVTSRLTANLAPRMMARVMEVSVVAGATTEPGQVLARLDDRELRAKAEQAAAAVAAATAQERQASADLRRARELFDRKAATRQDLDAAESRALATAAQARQATQAADEVTVLLGETNLRAPFAGIVARRLADPGDMGMPGQPVLVVYDPSDLRLEVEVGERCAATLRVGANVTVRLENPPRSVVSRLEEVAPVADAKSRTVRVKASLPTAQALRPGSFGALQVPCGLRDALLVPTGAVQRRGQLESVDVVIDDQLHTRHVRTGKPRGERIEILSGLVAGDRIAVRR